MRELKLIAESGWHAFPPRLEWQPIFYPVLNFEYAEQIARDWNTKDPASGFAGFVTRFEVDDVYAAGFQVQVVGAEDVHRELWVPAEELAEFNRHILGQIGVEAVYFGEEFAGQIDANTGLPVSCSGERHVPRR